MSNYVWQLVLGLVILVYCGYMLWSSYKLWRKDKAESASYLSAHPDAEKVSFNSYQSWLMVVLALVCFGCAAYGQALTPEGQEALLYIITYFCLGLIFLGLAIEVKVHRRLILTADGFYFAGDTYRFRMVSSMEQKRGLFKNFKVFLANGTDFEVPNKMGAFLQDKWQAWKAAKKQKRTRRGR